MSMHSTRPTQPADAIPESAYPTHPPMSRNRAAACVWYCALISKSAPASGDAARFMAGIK